MAKIPLARRTCNIPKKKRMPNRKAFIKQLMMEVFPDVFTKDTVVEADGYTTTSPTKNNTDSTPTRSSPSGRTERIVFQFSDACQSQIFVSLRNRQSSKMLQNFLSVKGLYQ